MTARRLTPDEVTILLNALDEYALKEDSDRSAAYDEEIGTLANALLDVENHPVSEIIVLLDDSTEGLEEMPDDADTAPEEDAEAEEASDELDADEDDEGFEDEPESGTQTLQA